MKKTENSTFHLVVNTIFIGLLLTFAIVYLTTMLLAPGSQIAPACYDGTVIEGDNAGMEFRRAVYQNNSTLDFIREYQYRLFGIADTNTVVMGENDFLFEQRNTENGYEYLQDYTGNLSFTEAELAAILSVLKYRQDLCTKYGATYLLVVIPNSQTVYSEYMPSYLGRISKDTRLTRLQDYLQQNGFYGCLDLTAHLKLAKTDGQLYHNTENAMNALGMYYAYQAVCESIAGNLTSPFEGIPRESLRFYRHATPGRSTAQKAGLAELALNHTVALSNDTPIAYVETVNSGLYTVTEHLNCANTSSLLLQFHSASDRTQSEIFFSNTFQKVTYQNRLSLTDETLRVTDPQVVVQFITESELARLIRK
ncbi:MAG: hypothetical protein IJY22_08390 [Clostridia bacterium]|nr:hypothetical protein [Clostridia bacterium]